MRGGTIFLVALVSAAAAIAAYVYRPHFDVCSEQQHIAADARREIERAALAYIAALETGDEAGAMRSMSRRGRAASEREPLAPVIAFMRQLPPRSTPRVEHTFRVTSMGWPREGATSPCRTAAVALGGTGATAHVIVSEDIGFGERTSAVWLEREGGAWRPRGLWTNITSAGGYDGGRFWRMAREQRAKGNAVNAALLYASAEQMLFRGPRITPYDLNAFRSDRSRFEAPAEVSGSPPHIWRLGGEEFTVTMIRFNVTVDESAAFEIRQRLPRWYGEAAADARNRALLEAFDAAHPEWREIAEALSVRAEIPESGGMDGAVLDRDAGRERASAEGGEDD